MRARGWRLLASLGFCGMALLYSAAVAAPVTLGFPYTATIGSYVLYAETPIDVPAIRNVLARADARLRGSALLTPQPQTTIYLTRGGWRWKMLSGASVGAFAISRPMSSVIVINRNDPESDQVVNGRIIGGHRLLSGVIAHEVTHNLLRRRFGPTIDWRTPAWKLEGYCDYVAGNGSLSDAEAKALLARHADHPALPYYLGRKRVAGILKSNGGSIDALFRPAT